MSNQDDRAGDEPLLVWLTIPRESVDEALIALRKGERFLHILRVLAREAAPMDVSWLSAQADANLSDLKRLEEEGLVLLGESQSWRDSLAQRDYVPYLAPSLTPEQQAVWQLIEARIKQWDWVKTHPKLSLPEFGEGAKSVDSTPPANSAEAGSDSLFLLHGVTGSGKTEIYLRAIELTLAQGRQALFLVPEIALTPQTIRRVAARFPGQVAVVHGSLSEGERYDTWRRARDGLISVVVGARSALFTPFPDLGLIVVDEEHDPSYKQGVGSQHPYYHVRDVAEQMVLQSDALLILGSATPELGSYFRAPWLLRVPRT
jgi:primosomal protein N' (replication factor Y)